MNKVMEKLCKDYLTTMLDLCQLAEQDKFKRMYAKSRDYSITIGDCVKAMSADSLSRAFDQVEETLRKRKLRDVALKEELLSQIGSLNLSNKVDVGERVWLMSEEDLHKSLDFIKIWKR